MSKLAKLIGKIVVGKIPTKEKARENFNNFLARKPSSPAYDTSIFDNGESACFAYSIKTRQNLMLLG